MQRKNFAENVQLSSVEHKTDKSQNLRRTWKQQFTLSGSTANSFPTSTYIATPQEELPPLLAKTTQLINTFNTNSLRYMHPHIGQLWLSDTGVSNKEKAAEELLVSDVIIHFCPTVV